MAKKAFELVGLDELEIEDARSFRHVGLFEDLKQALVATGYRFRVPAPKTVLPWDRAVFLNLAYWVDGDGGDVLTDRSIPADVVMHVAWHHLAARHLAPSAKADLLGEAIASAFDLYLVGRLLGHAPESEFLATQVPAMADAAAQFDVDDDAMEELLAGVSADPDRAFEDLRALLFGVTVELTAVEDAEAAMAALDRVKKHRFGPLLHHYELALWVANTRARRTRAAPRSSAGAHPIAQTWDADELHAKLVAAPSAIDWLAANWLSPSNQ